MRASSVLGFLLFGGSIWAQQYVISTLAGGAPPATPGPAVAASIGDPTRLAADAAGNVYFGSLHSVFKVDATGTLTRVAGNARPGNSGDGGPASAAELSFPMGIAIDAAGNLYVADRDASVVRKIVNGTISTVAGNGTAGFAGDGGAATGAQLNGPFGVAVDSSGNVYIADTGNEAVRKVSLNGKISTVAGTGIRGYDGDGGAAVDALLDGPEGVAVDTAGNLYIADTFNGRVRRVGNDGVIATVAGTGSTGIYSGDGGPAKSAALSLPVDVAVDRAGNLYIADFGNSKVRVVTNGVINTVAGRTNGVPLINGEAAINARLEGPTGVAVDSGGAFYFVEAGIGSGTGLALGDYKVWRVSTAGVLTQFAGNGVPNYSGEGVVGPAAQLNSPAGVAVGADGVVYIADSLNQRVRAITPPGGSLATQAGNGVAGFNGEIVTPRTALLNRPLGIAADAQGNWYVADTANSRVRKAQPGGNLFTIAGNGNASYFGDGGQAVRASVNQPEGVAVDSAGNVYIADTLDHAVRKVTPAGIITTLAGNGNPGYSGDGGPANQARLKQPRGVATDAAGNVYVADTGNNQVRRIDPLGTITTVGTGGALSDPRGVAVDGEGNVYVADTGNRVVRRVSPGGVLTTIAGNGTCCYSGDGGLALDAQLNQPWGIAVDESGNVYVADPGNNAVRVLTPVTADITVSALTNAASNLPGAVSPGEIMVLYGSGLGGVQTVLFNGAAGPLLYATPTQVGAVAPFALTGATVQVVAQSAAATSAPVSAAMGTTSPGVFTADGSGRGQVAAVNQDGTLNGTASPAPAGSVLTLYATGTGQTSPAGVDGKLAAAPLPQPVAPVTVTIGGVAAEVRYAGGAPGLIAGLTQVNVVVPAGVSGAAPLALRAGGVASQGGVTVAVR